MPELENVNKALDFSGRSVKVKDMSGETHLDWPKAKQYFDSVRQQYLDLGGVKGVNTSFALRIVFDPLSKRYNSGERTPELHSEMLSVE